MNIIKAITSNNIDSIWKFNQLDMNCLNMIIKGQWVFEGMLDELQMQQSLGLLLSYYPHLAGRVQDGQQIVLNNEGVPFEIAEKTNLKIADIQTLKKPLDFFNKGFSISSFIKGNSAPMNVQLTKLSNGSILSVHCAHVCLDGHGFFKMMKDWSAFYNGQPIEAPVLTVNSNIFSQPYSKGEALKMAIERKWKSVGIKELCQLMWQKITKVSEVVSSPIYLSDDQINVLRNNIEKENGKKPSKNATLSALATKLCGNLNGFKEPKTFSQITVMDIRDRVDGISSVYVGNAVVNIVTPEFQSDSTLSEIAVTIDNTIKSYLDDREKLEEYVKLNIATAENKLPFVPFSIKAMNSPKPTCVYTNNQLKFGVYDLDFGCGKPVFAFPNDLPDQIKFWPTDLNTTGVNIYLGGYLAKRYNKVRDKEKWLDLFLKSQNM